MQECKFFYTDKGLGGFAVMTYNTEFYVIVDIDRTKDEVRVKKLTPLPGQYHCIHVHHCYVIRGIQHACLKL